jgi:hypothetical protein
MEKQYKLVVYVPVTDAEAVRQAMGAAGAGRIGNYTFCSFTTTGIGRFKPEPGANPSIGMVGRLESVPEERIEAVCAAGVLRQAIAAIKAVHPYEEVALDVYPLANLEDLTP